MMTPTNQSWQARRVGGGPTSWALTLLIVTALGLVGSAEPALVQQKKGGSGVAGAVTERMQGKARLVVPPMPPTFRRRKLNTPSLPH